MNTRLLWPAIAIVLFTVSTTAQARQLFYFLVGDTVQTYDFNGVRQEAFQLPSVSPTTRTAMTTDGNTAWFVYRPKDGQRWISGSAIRPGGSGRSINIDYSTDYFFTGGLAISGDTIFLARDRMPHASYWPWYRIDRYTASTGGFAGTCTAQSSYDSMEWVDGYLAAIGSATNVHIYTGSCNLHRSFDVGSLYPGHGPTGLAANSQTIWVFYYAVGNNNGHAFDWLGNRRADLDIVFQGLATPTDACLAWGPDKAIVRPEPASLDFGDVPQGSQKSMPLRIRNVGNLPLTISSITLSDTANYAYPGPVSLSIAAGGHIDTTVTFQPQGTGLFSASLTIASNDPDHASLVFPLTGEGRATVSYVDASRPSSGVGTTWATAYATIADALASPGVLDGTEIWVRQGTYALSETLAINKCVAIYGGFAGTESSRSERDWEINATILDGGSIRRCVRITASNVTLDGFTIENGRNEASWPNYYGGGICVEGLSAVIQNCTVRNCSTSQGSGGGIAVLDAQGANSTIRNCLILDNTAGHVGGGVYNSAGNTTIADCTIAGNTAGSGGGITNQCGNRTAPVIRNCRIVANEATIFAGGGVFNDWTNSRMESCFVAGNTGEGIYNYVTSAAMINCTVVDNTGNGITVVYADETPSIINCIIWGNGGEQIYRDMGASPVVKYCIVGDSQYGTQPDANRNIRRAPSFVNPTGPDNNPATWQDNDYRLKPGSHGIDYADGNAAPELDLQANPRHDDTGTDNVGTGTPNYADLGAYEFQGTTPDVIYVDAAATGNQDGTSWADACTTIAQGVEASGSGKEIWIRKGAYVLSAPIEINKPLSIYGGFDGTEILRDYRNPDENVVTVDGNAAVSNCFMVRENAAIDGLTIIGGSGNAGSGINVDNASLTLAQCTLRDHLTGGALYVSNATVSISKCAFVNNRAEQGAACVAWMSTVIVHNCLFAGNRASTNAGALYIQAPPVPAEIANCTFVDNRAGTSGGAMVFNQASASIRNSIMWHNTASFYPQIAVFISGTASAEYCCIDASGFGLSNINADPLFASPGIWNDNGTPGDPGDDTYSAGDYRLLSEHGRWDPAAEAWVIDNQTSPCIDAGDPAADWSRETWPNGRRINIGCYGGTWEASKSGPIGPDLTRNGWVDEQDMQILAFAWLSDDPTCDIYPPGGDGIIDMHDFAAFAESYNPEPAPIFIDFETGVFDPAYTWQTGGTPGWTVIASDMSPDNQFQATSAAGTAPKYTNSWLTLTVDPNPLNKIRFDYCMLNSGNCIKGEFFVDNIKVAELTSKEWTQVEYTLAPGTHTLKWVATNITWMNANESMRLDNIRFFASPQQP